MVLYTVLKKRGFTEFNIVYKKKYDLNIALVYPSTYQASLSSLGYQTVYYILNAIPEIFAERVVGTGSHPAKSIERGTPLRRFPVILASLSYELDYPAFVNIMRSSGIPVKRHNRTTEDPLIIVGGSAVTGNPHPLFHIVDAVVRGESEETLPEIADALVETQGKPRKVILEELSEIKGVWVPDLKEDAIIRITNNLDKAFHPIRQIQNHEVEPVFGRSLMVEPSRGCNRGCTFCMEASITISRRERSFAVVKKIIEEGLRVNRVSKVAFYTLSFFDSTLGERLLEYLASEGIHASIPSVRADALNSKRIELMHSVGQRTVTVAPETPVFRLQQVLRKHITTEKILEVAHQVASLGMNLKLYYMVGIPGESMSDLNQIVSQVEKVVKVLADKRRLRITVNPFIPKPGTLLWRTRMQDKKTIKKKLSYLRKELSKLAGRVDVYPVNLAFFQYEVNRLGRDAFELIISQADKWLNSFSDTTYRKSGVEELG